MDTYVKSEVLATNPGNLPVVLVATAKTGGFGSRPVQKHDLQTFAGPNMGLYTATYSFPQI
jgi:hypothetical protein